MLEPVGYFGCQSGQADRERHFHPGQHDSQNRDEEQHYIDPDARCPSRGHRVRNQQDGLFVSILPEKCSDLIGTQQRIQLVVRGGRIISCQPAAEPGDQSLAIARGYILDHENTRYITCQ